MKRLLRYLFPGLFDVPPQQTETQRQFTELSKKAYEGVKVLPVGFIGAIHEGSKPNESEESKNERIRLYLSSKPRGYYLDRDDK